MKSPIAVRILLLGCLSNLPVWTAPPQAHAEGQLGAVEAARLERGNQLFNRVWKPAFDPTKGDGLGPMFNDKSSRRATFQAESAAPDRPTRIFAC